MKKLLLLLMLAQVSKAQPPADSLLKDFNYRNIGPFRTGGWITGFAVPEFPAKAHLYTYYVGTRNGGLWKTINNGTTFESIFPYHHTIGAVAVAPSNPNIVWTGTGESYATRSTYAGDGVYLSSDAGKSWKHMGLKETQHIVRILVHPKNQNTVYVASSGHLFTSNEERGVFKTKDGGRSWKKILYINDKVGVIDLVMHPQNPEILFAAAYEKYRHPWNFESGGPGSAIYKSIDGGKSWNKLNGGLPGGNLGRIGIDICRSNPNIMYAVIENLNLRNALSAEARQDSATGRPVQQRPIAGEVYRSDNGGISWRKVNRTEDNVGGKAAYSFNQITVHPVDPDKIYITGAAVSNSTDGGKTWRDLDYREDRFFPRSFGDARALWIDHKDPDRILFGSDGGVHISYDGGKTCDYFDNLPLGEVYALGVDMADPYNVYAGLQDHDSWKGPSNGWSGVITLENWVTVGGDDGMYNVIDPPNRWVYNTGQFGIHRRVDQETGIRKNIEPKAINGMPRYRYGWVPPMVMSPHNPKTIYTAAQFLFRSSDQGDNWQVISPDLTTNDPGKINGKGNVQFCTITTVSESSVTPGVIWVGTDDGRVQLSRDSGRHWEDVTASIANVGAAESKWVSRVLASAYDPAVAYVTKNGFREDDFKPYLFKTTDYGKTWQQLVDGLPNKPLNVIIEDPVSPQLLFVGNDAGVYCSFNGGRNWNALKGNMPVVPVHDLKIHPREKDLVVGTYGRGIWIGDISFLQEVSNEVLNKPVHLFAVEPKYFRVPRTFGGNYQLYGGRHIKAPNEANGLTINYYVKETSRDSATITIHDAGNAVVNRQRVKIKQGINSVVWNFGAGRNIFSSMRELSLKPGVLKITLQVNGEALTTNTEFKGVKGWPVVN
jgi:photosystem II stability/assembly factor-like uncharacterized protein